MKGSVAGAFKLLVLIHDGETKSYLARHPSFDRTVMLHRLPKPGSAECDELVGLMEGLSPAAQKMILERGEENGAGYLVTDKIPDFRNLRDWLAKEAPAPAPPVEPPASAPARGEFTRLFQASPEANSTPDPPAAQPPAQPTATQPGEFTRLFTGAQSSAATPVAGNIVEPAPTAPQPRKPGAFTKAFQALSESGAPPVPQPAESAPQPPRPSSRPGEFTALFHAPLPPAPEQQEMGRPVSRPREAPARPAFQQAGEFTRMFGVADRSPAPVESSKPPAQTDAQNPAAADPYESMFSVPPVSPETVPIPVAPAPPPAAPPSKSAASSNLPIIIILAVLLVLALGLVAYFALKR
jgi:hypothetical protein